MAEAREALRLAESDPVRAVAAAARAARAGRAVRDCAAGAVAERAWGLALRHRGDLDSAITHLREAVRLGRRAGSARLAGEARITLAFALTERGRPQRALSEIDAAIRELDGVPAAQARTQRGTILLGLGRVTEALASYRDALPVLREAGDLLWVYRVVWNRGLAHAFRHEFAAAETDLREAERLAHRLELSLSVGFAQSNLGFILARRGDVPAALKYFDEAEHRIREHSAQVGTLLQDRSELLLSVRLVAEARETAEQAIEEYQRERRGIKLPEVRLLLAQAAFLDGDAASALHHAQRAVREFCRHQRQEWAALARLAVLQTQCADEQRCRVSVRRVEDVVATVAAAGWPAAALEGRLLAAKLLLRRGRRTEGQAYLEQASRARRWGGPAILRARGWYAEALLRCSAGNSRGATSAIQAGLRVLDRHHAVLGATDLRAHVAGHRTELTELGLRIALEADRPEQVFQYAELGRASHLLWPPVRPPDDPVLARALAELRATVTEIEERRSADRSVAGLVQRQVGLERKIRDDDWRHGNGGLHPPAAAPVRLSNLATQMRDAALLEFVQLDGMLHAISVIDGQPRLHQLGPVSQADDLLDRIEFAVPRLIHHENDEASRIGAYALLADAAERLDTLLLRPLHWIGDRPLIVVPTGPLQRLPWALLPSCSGRPVTVSPSASLWHTAALRPVPAGRITVAAGPGLQCADEEAAAVAAIYGTTALVGSEATADAVTAALDGARLAHLAAHGQVRADNPLFCSLLLADGPLMVYDLERLRRAPHTVVLAACDTGRPVVRAGDELLGLTATFLALGAAQLVASVLPILDAETAPLMTAFHRLLATGDPPAVALARAQLAAKDDGTAAMVVAAGFVCLGAGLTPDVPIGPMNKVLQPSAEL